MAKLNSLNANIIAISVDSPFSNKEFKEKNNLGFPVYSDYLKITVKNLGIEQQNFGGMKGYVAAKRSVFILDSSGKVSFKWISDDPGKEPDYDVLMSEVAKVK